MNEDKLLTISEKDMRAMMLRDPFVTLEHVPIVQVRMSCLEMIGSTERCFPKLVEQAYGWLEFFLETGEYLLASKLLNVWLFHRCHTRETLASAINLALSVMDLSKFADRTAFLEVLSREVCSRVRRDICVYWDTPRLHSFLDECLKLALWRPFCDKEQSVVRRALRVICEAEDTSMSPRLLELRNSYRDLYKKGLEESPRNTFELWQKVGIQHFDTVLSECMDFLVDFTRQEIEQWKEFKRLLSVSAGKIVFLNLEPRLDYRSGPATVSLTISGAKSFTDKSQLMNMLDGLTVTFVGDGIKDSQVNAFMPTEAGGKVGRFDQNLNCQFRLEGLEGKKRYRLLVHATKPVPEIRPTLLCELTGYVNFA